MATSNSTNITDPESVLILALSDIAAIADLLALHHSSGMVPDAETMPQVGYMIRERVKEAQEVVRNYVRYEQPKADGGVS